jgi:hypothetical protein
MCIKVDSAQDHRAFRCPDLSNISYIPASANENIVLCDRRPARKSSSNCCGCREAVRSAVVGYGAVLVVVQQTASFEALPGWGCPQFCSGVDRTAPLMHDRLSPVTTSPTIKPINSKAPSKPARSPRYCLSMMTVGIRFDLRPCITWSGFDCSCRS